MDHIQSVIQDLDRKLRGTRERPKPRIFRKAPTCPKRHFGYLRHMFLTPVKGRVAPIGRRNCNSGDLGSLRAQPVAILQIAERVLNAKSEAHKRRHFPKSVY